jgi:hypothetical protein
MAGRQNVRWFGFAGALPPEVEQGRPRRWPSDPGVGATHERGALFVHTPVFMCSSKVQS